MRAFLFAAILLFPLLTQAEVIVTVTNDTLFHLDLGAGNTADKPMPAGSTLILLNATPTDHPGQIQVQDKATGMSGYLAASDVDLSQIKDNVTTTAQDLIEQAKTRPQPIAPKNGFIPDPNEPPIDGLVSFANDIYANYYADEKHPPADVAAQLTASVKKYGIGNLVEFSRHKTKYLPTAYSQGGGTGIDEIQRQIILPAVQALSKPAIEAALPPHLQLSTLSVDETEDTYYNITYSFHVKAVVKGDLFGAQAPLALTHHAGDSVDLHGTIVSDHGTLKMRFDPGLDQLGLPKSSFSADAAPSETPPVQAIVDEPK